MIISQELTAAILRERRRHVAHHVLAREVACLRAARAPTRLDRIAGRLGLNDCVGGTMR